MHVAVCARMGADEIPPLQRGIISYHLSPPSKTSTRHHRPAPTCSSKLVELLVPDLHSAALTALVLQEAEEGSRKNGEHGEVACGS
jgi:hypothetical protein